MAISASRHMHHSTERLVSEQARYEALLRETTKNYQEKLHHAPDAQTADPICMELLQERNAILQEMKDKRLPIPKEYQEPDYQNPHRHHT